jgi:selenocysteine lyase/cysteine desulfurase
MDRRDFLVRTGLLVGAAALAQARNAFAGPAEPVADIPWLRAQFELDPSWVHMTRFFFTSHPRPVREAIERRRKVFDADPVNAFFAGADKDESAALTAAAAYIGGEPTDIALTDSTTMGLGLLYGMLDLAPGQEILTTTHDHYSTVEALRWRAERTGAVVKAVPLYAAPAKVTTAEVVDRLTRAITPKTRVIAVTWVHSSTGVKLPISAMAHALARLNAGRDERDRILLCVDGVHGFGNQVEKVAQLGCDFFVAGTHKWIFGPRGTGLVWGRPAAWKALRPLIPPFNGPVFDFFEGRKPREPLPPALTYTPGGFKAYEHRWSVTEAFALHTQVGPDRIAAQTVALNQQLKEGLAKLRRVVLHTPMAPELSAGINAFAVDGMSHEETANRLKDARIIASTAPYPDGLARLSCNAANAPEDVEKSLAAMRAIAG